MENLDLNENGFSDNAVFEKNVSLADLSTKKGDDYGGNDTREMKLSLDESVAQSENVFKNEPAEGAELDDKSVYEDGLVTAKVDVDDTTDVLKNLGEEFGKIKYLSNEQNLEILPVNHEMMDENAPFESLTMAGKWLREALNLKNYWQGIERFGEDVATYTWAYKQGKMGAFDGKTFAKEAVKAGARSLGRDTLMTTGNLLSMFGANLAKGSAMTTLMTSGAGLAMAKTGELYQEIGQAFRSYAEAVENADFLKPSLAAYEDDPSFAKLANVIGGGASQVLAMAGISRLIGARATYGLFAGGGAGEVFNESFEKDGDVAKANELAMANAGVSFAIDKIFDPLPETIAKNAKLTSQKVATEILGAPLREAGSEMLQQMLAENLVRQVGIDDTQDLFEGLLESALGAFVGSSMVAGTAGAVYFVKQNLENARQRILLKGVGPEELELYEKNMMALIETKPQAFEKILGVNLQKNLKQMDLAARQIKNRKERALKRGEIKDFHKVYDEMYARFFDVLGDEKKAGAAAKMFEANAVSLYKWDSSLSPKKLLDGFLPKLEKNDVVGFLAKKLPEDSLSYSLIGVKAKHADMGMLTSAIALDRAKADPQLIWRKTGWHKGGEGRWRMEISDKDAVIKPWSDEEINMQVTDFFKQTRQQAENIRAWLAASLHKSAMKDKGVFYQDFYEYLKQNSDDFKWDKTKTLRQNIYDVIEQTDLRKRQAQDLLLDGLMDKYRQMHPEKFDSATIDEAFDELVKRQGKTYDFSEEEYRYIMGVLEDNDRYEFFKKYWDSSAGRLNARVFEEMATTKAFEYGDNPEFDKGLLDVAATAFERRAERKRELKRQRVYPAAFFFDDINRDEAYGAYRVYQGKFDAAKQNFVTGGYPQSYLNAYRPIKLSEKFLDQEQYAYMKDDEKRELSQYLDNVERIFRIERYLDEVDDYQQLMPIGGKRMRMSDFYDENGRLDKAAIQKKMMTRRNKKFRLKDILDHKELYDNYPEAAEMTVRFAVLLSGEPYHAYFDDKEGYVLEVDPQKINGANMKEIFLRGGMFVVQDIEGFDYSLTDAQRRNFMNRQLYMAAREVEETVADNLKMFVYHYLPGVNYHKFLVERYLPMPLMRLNKTMDISKIGVREKDDKTHFLEVDYEKLTEAVLDKYQYPQSVEGYPIRDLAYMELQNLQNLNASLTMTAARANGGYHSILLPWAGVTSQGGMDARALSQRMNMSQEELRKKPFFDTFNAMPLDDGARGGDVFQPDFLNAYDEFAEKISRDAENYHETLAHLAQGVYDSANRTITLFEKADAQTIVHETFHYFWDMMQQVENRRESHGADFHDVVSDLRADFARAYRVEQHNGKWFAVDKNTGELAAELMRGFDTQEDVLDAGVSEIFVNRFMAQFEDRALSKYDGRVSDAISFYRDWMLTLTDQLGISVENASEEGRRLLRFFANKRNF